VADEIQHQALYRRYRPQTPQEVLGQDHVIRALTGAIREGRLHHAFLCGKHLLCPLCAIRRGSKALATYLPRYDTVRGMTPALRPFLVTLTVKDGPELVEPVELESDTLL